MKLFSLKKDTPVEKSATEATNCQTDTAEHKATATPHSLHGNAAPTPLFISKAKPLKRAPLKSPNRLWHLLGLALILSALAWYFLGQSSEPNQPINPTHTQVKPKAAPNTQTTVAPTPMTSQASTTLPASAVMVDNATSSSAQATAAIPTITPEEILKPNLPEDPAIAREEMLRLSEQSAQLTAQEAMMQDQLRMMNELSSKKEEHIKLLEQQIAQLEQQNASNK